MAEFATPSAPLSDRRLPVLTGVAIWPDYLAYFNRLSGGPARGYRHLVDSSLDWGQDLPALATWLKREKLANPDVEPVYLSYFGTGSPDHHGIRARRLPDFFDPGRLPMLVPLEGGVYCISASMLQLYGAAGTSPWGAGEEQTYRELRSRLEPVLRRDGTIAYGEPDIERYDRLRLARLLETLRDREPDDAVGHSILIYRLSESDLHRALQEEFRTNSADSG